jgi:arylsulfatase A-like enzyme/Flp pilus assembly protein TadD
VTPSRSRRARWLLAAATLAAVLAGGWLWLARPHAPAHGALRGANVLLVTIDTLRADRLGAYGSDAGLTPTLDALAARGVRFTHAWSHAPITLVAHASILTGLAPPHHGVRNNGAFRLGDGPQTFAASLKHAGYRTGAFVGAFVLDARFGLNRGFDEYDDRYGDAAATNFSFVERTADRVLHAATSWIGAHPAADGRPWFAWVHLFDPHAPYRAPARFTAGRAPYDAEVAWTDAALGQALADLSARGDLDRTLIVITADHGESLGEHGETTHGLFAYDATLRVPLIIAGPDIPHATASARTAHADILPTVLDLVGVDAPSPLDGRSRREALAGGSAGTDAIYLESLDANLTRGWAPLTGIIAGRWKYIDLPEPELYDLEGDPSERTNLFTREPQQVRELRVRLREWTAAPSAATARSSVSAADAARLQSLGYFSGAATTKPAYAEEDDPKRLVALSETFNTALEAQNEGHADAALTALSQVLAKRPDFLAARLSAATILTSQRRAPDAVRLLRGASSTDQDTTSWLTTMGQALAAAGELRDARSYLARAAAGDGDPEPLNALGIVLLQLGEHAAARDAFHRLVAIDPSAAGTWYNLGLLEMSAQRPSDAAAAFRRAVAIDPRYAGAWQGLGAALAATEPAAAADAWRHAVELEPRDFDTLFNLGMLLATTGRAPEAAGYLRRFLDSAPRDRYAADFPRVRAALARAEAGR